MTQAEILRQRTFDFAVAVFQLCRPLMRGPEARVPTGQLVRASASVAANYRASCRAKSKRDFIAKLGTVIEESDESLKLQSESNQFMAIFTAITENCACELRTRKESAKVAAEG